MEGQKFSRSGMTKFSARLENVGKGSCFSAEHPITAPSSSTTPAEPNNGALCGLEAECARHVPRMRRFVEGMLSVMLDSGRSTRGELPLARCSPGRGFAYDCVHFLFSLMLHNCLHSYFFCHKLYIALSLHRGELLV